MLLGLSAAVVHPFMRDHDGNPVATIIRANVNVTAVGPATATPVPDGSVDVTRSGLELFVPRGIHRHCFNAPRVCTPNPAPNLRLLRPDDPDGGFVVDGEWAMIDWPYDWLPGLLPALRELRSR